MFERIQNDGVVPKITASDPHARAELVVTPAPASSELREKAVAPIGSGLRSSTENDASHPLLQVIGQVRAAVDEIALTDADRKRLDEIYAKLFKAYGNASAGQASDETDQDVEQTLKNLEKMLLGHSDGAEATDTDPTDENAAALALRWQRENTLEKISLALRKVGSLRSKLGDASDGAHDRLLNINSSIAGLNLARSQVDDSTFSIASAASVVDSVMLNLRSAVLAHGKISADVVRLVMN